MTKKTRHNLALAYNELSHMHSNNFGDSYLGHSFGSINKKHCVSNVVLCTYFDCTGAFTLRSMGTCSKL